MDVTVVGATGNIGTALLDALAVDPDVGRVRAVARRPPDREWPKTTFLPLDISTDDLAPAVDGADAVVHLAWILQPRRRPTETWRVNVGGAVRVFDAIVRHRVPALVCSSSVGAYSPAPGREVDETWETDGLPTTGYGREKAYVERLLDALEARHTDIRVVRMRPAFVFQQSSGTAQRQLFLGPFVPTALLRPGALPAVPFPAGLRLQVVHAADAARAFVLALHSTGARGAFNIAAEPVVDGRAVASVLGSRVLLLPPRTVRAALSAAWLARLSPAEPALFDLAMGLPVMRTERARAELGWSPATSSTDALAEVVRGMCEGTGGDTPPLARRPSPRARRPSRPRARAGRH